jgi:hypothetical protein
MTSGRLISVLRAFSDQSARCMRMEKNQFDILKAMLLME